MQAAATGSPIMLEHTWCGYSFTSLSTGDPNQVGLNLEEEAEQEEEKQAVEEEDFKQSGKLRDFGKLPKRRRKRIPTSDLKL